MWFANYFSRNTTTKITQGANLVALATALFAISQDPDSAAEYGLDVLVHGATFMAIRDGAGLAEGCGASALNLLRLGALYAGITGNCSSAPMAALVIDTGFHLWNTVYSFIATPSSKEQNEAAAAPKAG